MSKIYSRPRIKLPIIRYNKFDYNKKIGNKEKNKKINLIIIIIIAFSTAKLVLDAVLPIFNNLCENRAESIATTISNEQATLVMEKHSYSELYNIQKDNNGNVTMINANIILINEIMSDIANKIQKEIDKKGIEDIEISIGNFTGLKILANKGPAIKIRILPVGNVETELKSEFKDKGVNQTLHRIYLQVKCKMSIITPFEDISKEIINQVLLAENIIIGNIPNNYYNLDGINLKSNE